MDFDVTVLSMRETAPAGVVEVDTTSHSRQWSVELSPFRLGPCELYSGYKARLVECAWQFCKTYPQHADANGDPTPAYWEWALRGWASERPVRYPMGKGAKPLYSLWDGERLDYVAARKRIYIPLYVRAVWKTKAWGKLVGVCRGRAPVVLRDFDGYDHRRQGMTLTDVLHNTKRPMGHSFVLLMMLVAYGRGAANVDEILRAMPLAGGSRNLF